MCRCHGRSSGCVLAHPEVSYIFWDQLGCSNPSWFSCLEIEIPLNRERNPQKKLLPSGASSTSDSHSRSLSLEATACNSLSISQLSKSLIFDLVDFPLKFSISAACGERGRWRHVGQARMAARRHWARRRVEDASEQPKRRDGETSSIGRGETARAPPQLSRSSTTPAASLAYVSICKKDCNQCSTYYRSSLASKSSSKASNLVSYNIVRLDFVI
jgi:hypothetical protein